MLQLRDASDPWSEAASGDVVDMTKSVGANIGDKFASLFSTVASTLPSGTMPATSATTPSVTISPVPQALKPKAPWYKTPIGVLGILAGAFAGYKYVYPKFRKRS